MSFPRYPAYKPSGVEWLGDVPSEWKVRPLKSIACVINGFPFDSKSFDPNEGFPLVRIRDLNQSSPDTRYKGEFVDSAAISNDDVLIGMDGDFNVGRWLGEVPALLNQRMCCVRTDTPMITRYLQYALPAPLDAINRLTYATTVKHLSSFDVLKIRLAMPPDESRVAEIVSFLDHETTKIDALIAEQQRLTELLQEKRHAVTKGLNQDAPMKDSGVEWLGEVPEHWEVIQLKWLTPVKRGASPRPIDDPIYFDEQGEYAWVRISDVTVSSGRLKDTTQRLSVLGSDLSVKLEPGALFVSIAGSVGKPCISEIKACIHDGFVYFPLLPLSPEYLMLIFESGACFGGLGKLGTQLNLNTDTIGSIYIAVPPEADEIERIIRHCSSQVGELHKLSESVTSAISLLQERRSALISAAVTGQIDVRGLVPEDETA